MIIFSAYKTYPFSIPLRVKLFNLFRALFLNPELERFLVTRILNSRSKFWRRLIPPIYFYRKGNFRNATRGGITYRLDLSKQLDHSIYFTTVRDVAWNNLFQLLKPHFKIIDVGANIGYLSLNFAMRCPQGIVYAFEPDSETFRKLSENVQLNSFNNIHVFKTAVGAHTGTGELYKIYESNPGANRILHDRPPGHALSETVSIATLDDYDTQERFGDVSLIKIDVEGFELFVLQGARNLIKRCKPILFVELVDQNLLLQGCSGDAILKYVEELGYRVLDGKTMGPLARTGNYYTDIVCFPGDPGEA